MQKRGLSAIITMIIVILLVLVGFVFVWFAVKNFISEGVDISSTGKVFINLEIKNVNIGVDSVNVTVKRNIGEGEISKLKFIVSNDDTTEVIEKTTNIGELEQATFNINTTICMNKISVAPVIKLESGKEIIGEIKDTIELEEENLIKNVPGLVSWWRFEGNADDEIGESDGTLMNGVNCNVQGKYGKACKFDAIDDYVNMGNDSSLHPITFTLSAWIYYLGGGWKMVIGNEQFISAGDYRGFWLDIAGENSLPLGNDDHLYFLVGGEEFGEREGENRTYTKLYSTGKVPLNSWTYVVATFDGKNASLYINGIMNNTIQGVNISYTNHINNLSIGMGGDTGIHFFNGTIDEVMIFNRALSADEVKKIHGCYFN